jgi:acetolactate synthase regulatory subunit
MNTSDQSPIVFAVPVPEPAASCWRLQVAAVPEPLLLARVLQKFSVPEIELHAVCYAAFISADLARVELTFAARPERARLATARLQKLIGMQEVTLSPFD